jgi:hypothetical protein
VPLARGTAPEQPPPRPHAAPGRVATGPHPTARRRGPTAGTRLLVGPLPTQLLPQGRSTVQEGATLHIIQERWQHGHKVLWPSKKHTQKPGGMPAATDMVLVCRCCARRQSEGPHFLQQHVTLPAQSQLCQQELNIIKQFAAPSAPIALHARLRYDRVRSMAARVSSAHCFACTWASPASGWKGYTQRYTNSHSGHVMVQHSARQVRHTPCN